MSGLAEQLVRLAARALPPRVRDRYREEWSADLRGAGDVGVSRSSIALGALATAITIDRLDPAVSGLALGALFRHRLRVATGLGVAGLVLLAGWYLYGGYWSAGGILAYVGTVSLLAGLALTAAAVVALLGAAAIAARSARPVIAVTLLLVPIALVGLVLARMLGFLMILVGPLVLVLGAGAIALSGSARTPARTSRRAAIAAVFALVALGTCALGILHVFVWNPLARVPGLTLEEIYARLAAANEGVAALPWSIAWSAITVLAVAGLVIFATARRFARLASTRRLVVLGLLVLTGTTVVGFLPSFSMGMGLADTFMTSGGDAAPTGPLLAVLGQAALAIAVLVAFVRPVATPGVVAAVR